MHPAALILVLLVAHSAAYPAPTTAPKETKNWYDILKDALSGYFHEKYTNTRVWAEGVADAMTKFLQQRDVGQDLRNAETTLVKNLKEVSRNAAKMVGLGRTAAENKADTMVQDVLKDMKL
ncbi:uncharacterized protein [Drosophila bipectinata]|uniref:uncharacterized protein isoform X2 n=1 Tax=Drosophila bipectinata TaxID=42026 RepID=UPI001C8AC228|nr:uncharacterized protein LOC108123171 [Drosophila bipectinata]